MKVRISKILVILAVAFIFPMTVAASITQSDGSCTSFLNSGGPPRICLFEDEYWSGGQLRSTSGTDSLNLGNINHSLPGNCNAGPFPEITWNDCISSVTWELANDQWLCVYKDTYFGGSTLSWQGSGAGSIQSFNFSLGSFNDAISSFAVINSPGNPC